MGARRQECADARVHIHPRRVLRAAASGDCLDVVPKDGDPVFRGRLFAWVCSDNIRRLYGLVALLDNQVDIIQ